jgi:hypothetical protein
VSHTTCARAPYSRTAIMCRVPHNLRTSTLLAHSHHVPCPTQPAHAIGLRTHYTNSMSRFSHYLALPTQRVSGQILVQYKDPLNSAFFNVASQVRRQTASDEESRSQRETTLPSKTGVVDFSTGPVTLLQLLGLRPRRFTTP